MIIEMSQATKCQLCNEEFESQMKVPVVLPCKHNICLTCVSDYYQKNMNIKCFNETCQIVHKIHPINLQKDNQLLKFLEQKGLLDTIALLESQKTKIQSAQILLAKQQANFLCQVIHHINDQVFKERLTIQRKLKQIDKQLTQQLKYLKLQLLQINKQGYSQQCSQENLINPNLEQLVLKLATEAQEAFNQNSKIQINVFEEKANMVIYVNTLTQEKNSQISQIKQLNQKLQLILQEKTIIKNDLANLNGSLINLNQVNKDYATQIQQMNQQIQSFKQEKVNFEKQIQALANENQLIRAQLSECQNHYCQYQQQFSQDQQQNLSQTTQPQQYYVQNVQAAQQQQSSVTKKQDLRNLNIDTNAEQKRNHSFSQIRYEYQVDKGQNLRINQVILMIIGYLKEQQKVK